MTGKDLKDLASKVKPEAEVFIDQGYSNDLWPTHTAKIDDDGDVIIEAEGPEDEEEEDEEDEEG